jgi:hypothetical protein
MKVAGMVFTKAPYFKFKALIFYLMEEDLSNYARNNFSSEKFQKLQQLINYEQELVQKRLKWQFELENSIKLLYQLKKDGVLD